LLLAVGFAHLELAQTFESIDHGLLYKSNALIRS
jgi:hypothetical protein